MDEELIELVRGHEELYNFSNKKYWDNVHKNKLWQQFAVILQKDRIYCKKRWESLRSQFRKICRTRNTATGEATQNVKTWKYEDELSFLLPYMKNKSRVTSMDSSSDESRKSTAVDRTSEDVQHSEIDNSEEIPSCSLHEAVSTHSTPKFTFKRKHPSPRQHESSGKKKTVSIPETATSTVMKYILDQKTAGYIQPKHPLDLFFDSIKESVKSFSPQDQHMAKKKIFEIVSEIEGNYLNSPDNPQSIQHYPSFVPESSHYVSLVPSGPSSSQSASSSSCASDVKVFSPDYDEQQ